MKSEPPLQTVKAVVRAKVGAEAVVGVGDTEGIALTLIKSEMISIPSTHLTL